MTDSELMNQPEVEAIARYLKAITAEMVKLQKKFGKDRPIALFAEGESGVHLMDSQRDDAACDKGNMSTRQLPLADGGPRIASYSAITALWWSGGGW